MDMFLLVVFIFSLHLGNVAGHCDLADYDGSQFQPNPARVHVEFLPALRNINSYAKECRVKVYVTSSYRSTTQVAGAIVPPATRSNHLVGHAIDMNLKDETTGVFCNSRCLGRKDIRPNGVTCFINKIESDVGLRWGGGFSTPDPVHIDDAINIHNPELWDQLYQQLQKNCS